MQVTAGVSGAYRAVKTDDSDGPIERWEYSAETGLENYLKTNGGKAVGSYLDYALASWGRHGWELISVVPYDDRLVAFFKRPVQEAAD